MGFSDSLRKKVRKEVGRMEARTLPPDIDPAAQARIAEAERLEREAQARARGRASTVLTSGEGDTSEASLVRRILGG